MAELGALGALAAGLWLLGILFLDFGPIVIFLFVTVIGNFMLAIMTLIDIKRTWKPVLLFFISLMLATG